MPVKVREAIKQPEDDGSRQTSQKSSHRKFEHPTKSGKVTLPVMPAMIWIPRDGKAFRSRPGGDKED